MPLTFDGGGGGDIIRSLTPPDSEMQYPGSLAYI